MLNNITQIVRSNSKAVMIRVGNGSAANAVYTIFDLKTRQNTYTGTLSGAKSRWNRAYKNSRQFVTRNGLNHRYMGA
jgi:hypothetical protein